MQAPILEFAPDEPFRLSVQIVGNGSVSGGSVMPTSDQAIVAPAPRVIGVVQQPDADLIKCDTEDQSGQSSPRVGRVVAALFSEEVTKVSVQHGLPAQSITNYEAEANQVVGVA